MLVLSVLVETLVLEEKMAQLVLLVLLVLQALMVSRV